MRRDSYPKPPVPYQGHSPIHFATERQVRSLLSVGDFDRGELQLEPGRLVFTGMHCLVDCPQVTAVALVRKTFPWGIFLVLASLVAADVYLKLPLVGDWPLQPAVYWVGGLVLLIGLMQWNQRWVEVRYLEGGEKRKAFFRQEFAWVWLPNRQTRRLCEKIRVAVLEGAAADGRAALGESVAGD